MKNYPILILSNLIFFLIIGISTKSYAITSPLNDSTNILVLSKKNIIRPIFDNSIHAFEKGDDVIVTTKNDERIEGVITKIADDTIYISTKNNGIQTVDIARLKSIKRFKTETYFWGFLAKGLGILLLIIGLLSVVIFISSLINSDTGGGFFAALGASLIILLDFFLSFKLLKGGMKRLFQFKKFKVGKKWDARIIDKSKTRSYQSLDNF